MPTVHSHRNVDNTPHPQDETQYVSEQEHSQYHAHTPPPANRPDHPHQTPAQPSAHAQQRPEHAASDPPRWQEPFRLLTRPHHKIIILTHHAQLLTCSANSRNPS